MKPKILFITSGLTTGGAEMMLYRLLSRINLEKFYVTVICLGDRNSLSHRIEELGIPVHTLRMGKDISALSKFQQLIAIVQQLKPDLIQGWMYHGNLAAQIISLGLSNFLLKRKIPLLLSIHSSGYSLKLHKKTTAVVIKLSAFLSRFAASTLYVSRDSQSHHKLLGYCDKNNFVIDNGIDTQTFKPSALARSSLRKELGLSEESILIGLIARFHPLKDHANFCQAASLLLKSVPDLNLQFVLVGRDINWNNHYLSNLIKELKLVNRIHLLDERQDIPKITAALDIASLSSYSEALPIVIGEAMSCGVSCVVTDVGDAGRIVSDTGRVVPPRNPKELANAWQELLELGVEGRQKLGKLARARITANFSLEACVSQYEEIYTNLLGITTYKSDKSTLTFTN